MSTRGEIRRALLSVHDKTGLVELARGLHGREVQLLASGGTARALAAAGIPVTPVEEFTREREVLDGRVKTLHPRIHAGILADRRVAEHMRELNQHGWWPIDLVVCNLYPFRETLAAGAAREDLVASIDVGGPTMIRAAAKNADGGVTVLTDPADYAGIVELLRDEGGVPQPTRRRLAAKAFRLTATYDAAVAGWAEGALEGAAPAEPDPLAGFAPGLPLRYGENPHQRGWLMKEAAARGGVAQGRLLAGKELSYNNYLDLDAAWRAVGGLAGPAVAVVKHGNPCGLAEAGTQAEAFRRAYAGDPLSAFGGVLGFSTPLEAETVAAIQGAKLFVECIAAPGFSDEARELLAKRTQLRLLEVPPGEARPPRILQRIGGGLLVQDSDPGPDAPAAWQVAGATRPGPGMLEELLFAMRAAMHLKSNAIALTRDRALVGMGAGQTSRVDAARQAIEKAGERARGAVMASDAFFPFDDCVKLAAAAGVTAIAQPGGSKNDAAVVAAADAAGLVMVFTGRRHFRH